MNLFDQMLSRYDIKTESERLNAMHEIMQEITLAGLYRGGFFEKAAFFGGTCLRIFHGLSRFSEDMDFTLLNSSGDFIFEDYFPDIISEFKSTGRTVEIIRKIKRKKTDIESAFLNDATEIFNISFRTEKVVKIKLEVELNPPGFTNTEQKLLLHPFSFFTRCVSLPDMFAGKIHALLFRNWKIRIKGRYWYDFEWYIRNNVPLNFESFRSRTKQINGIDIDLTGFTSLLFKRLSETEIEKVIRDVMPFIRNHDELKIWSNEYFTELAKRIIVQ